MQLHGNFKLKYVKLDTVLLQILRPVIYERFYLFLYILN